MAIYPYLSNRNFNRMARWQRGHKTAVDYDLCAFTGFEHAIHSDMTWNMAALTDLVNAINVSVASEPYRLDVEMSSLGKWDPINATLVVLDPHAEEKLTAGDYQFITAVRIDGEDAKQYRLPKATEEALSVSVDATPWTVDRMTNSRRRRSSVTVTSTSSAAIISSTSAARWSSNPSPSLRGRGIGYQDTRILGY